MPNANWSNPTLTSTYTNFVSEVKNRDEDLALQFDGTTSTNIPTNTIRWDSTANRWKKWSGSAWAELTSTYALTGLTTTGAASIGGTLGVTGAATLSAGGTSTTSAADTNTTAIATTAFVIGQAASVAPLQDGTAAVGTSLRYARQDHVHPADTTRAPLASPTFTGTVTIPAGASISGYAPLASPTFTGTVTIPAGASISGYAPLASPSFTGAVSGNSTFSDSKGELRTIPQNAQTSAYTLVAADHGKHISITTGGVTVPASIFSAGQAVSIYNNSSASQTITTSAVTAYLAGSNTTKTSFTLATRGLCTVFCVASNVFILSGGGLT